MRGGDRLAERHRTHRVDPPFGRTICRTTCGVIITPSLATAEIATAICSGVTETPWPKALVARVELVQSRSPGRRRTPLIVRADPRRSPPDPEAIHVVVEQLRAEPRGHPGQAGVDRMSQAAGHVLQAPNGRAVQL